MLTITVRFSTRSLAGANAGVDLDASGERYRAALLDAIRGEFSEAEIDVARDDAAPLRVEVSGVDETRAREVARSVTDLAWVVKQCAPWGVASS